MQTVTTTTSQANVQVVSQQDLNDFLNVSGFANINDNTKTTFLKLAAVHGLNPFKKEIYITGYKTKDGREVYSVVTGYQTFIKIANRTSLLDGWEAEPLKENGKLTGARVTIYRKDWTRPFRWEVSLKEFSKGQSTWDSMPEFMIKKVAIGQGFRLCFEGVEGVDMNGLYEEAEIVGEDPIYNIAKKKFSELFTAVSKAGISLRMEGDIAIAEGNTHQNAKLLKGLEFSLNQGKWSVPCEDDREQTTIPAQPSTLQHSTLIDTISSQLILMGLSVKEVTVKGVEFAIVEGETSGHEDRLTEMGFALGKTGKWGMNLTEAESVF